MSGVAAQATPDPRERILETAVSMMASYGIDGVSLQMLADRVGLHKSTLFHHFSGKSEIAGEALGRVLGPVVECMSPLRDTEPPHLDQLVAVGNRLVDHFAENRGAALFLLRCVVGPDGFEREAERLEDPAQPAMRVFIELGTWLYRAREAGAIRHVRVRHALLNLLGLVLLFPAISDGLGRDVLDGDPASERSRRARKEELSTSIRGMFEVR